MAKSKSKLAPCNFKVQRPKKIAERALSVKSVAKKVKRSKRAKDAVQQAKAALAHARHCLSNAKRVRIVKESLHKDRLKRKNVPSVPADAVLLGTVMRGNNGKRYRSVRSANGIRWQRVKRGQ